MVPQSLHNPPHLPRRLPAPLPADAVVSAGECKGGILDLFCYESDQVTQARAVSLAMVVMIGAWMWLVGTAVESAGIASATVPTVPLPPVGYLRPSLRRQPMGPLGAAVDAHRGPRKQHCFC